MTAQQNPPTPIRRVSSAAPSVPPRVGSTVEAQLEETLFKLLGGELELSDLTPGLAAWFAVGHAQGFAAGQAVNDARLRWERDLFYFCYTNRKTPADFYNHQTSALWREAVAA